MGAGENIDKVIDIGSMDDVGTRFKHLIDLYELWLTGIEILDRYDKDTPFYHEKRLELVHATQMLLFHLQKDYNQEEDRKKIDAIPFTVIDEKPKP